MRTKLGLATAILVLSSLSFAQGGSYGRQVIAPTLSQGGTGQPASYALVRVCPSTATGFPCSPLVANVYSDQALTQPLPASFAADVDGRYQFFIGTGAYIVQETNAIGAGYTFAYSWLIFSNGTGTVSSVALSMPASLFSVSGSPITISGTFNVSLINQAGYSIFANCNSTSNVPTFCALNANMVPGTLNATTFPSITTTAGASIGTTLNVGTTSLLSGAVTASTSVATPFVDASVGYKIGGSYGTSGLGLVSTGSGTTFGPVNLTVVGFGCGPLGVSTTPLYCGRSVQDGATELNVAFPVSRTGTLSNLYCFVYPTPGISQFFAFTLDVGTTGGLSSTGITCTAQASNNGECGDLANTYSVSNGTQLIALHLQPSGTTSAVNASCTVNLQ